MKKLSEIIKADEEIARTLLSSEDYRAFLKSYFRIKKIHNPSYSYAVFARQAKLAKSLPRDVTEGLKRLTDKTLPSFLKAMELEGLMEEFFVQLVAAETDPQKKKLVNRLADLYLEAHFTHTYNDSNFQDYRSPFLYAASGEVDAGVKLDILSKRTGLSLQQVREAIPALERLKLGRYIQEDDRFTPCTSQVHVIPERDKNFFTDFYLYCLNLQRESVVKKFNSDDTLFYNEVFSVNEKELPALKVELKKVLKSYVLKAENPHGDSVAVLNLGLFKQFFQESIPQ